MINYIVRRLFLLIPTVLGITFLVFMLIAMAPGGIGAALMAGAGGDMDASQRAQQEAYLEDRYGLGDPVVVQYFRWLERISPVKFGTRDQINLRGDIVRPPRTIEPHIRWDWFHSELPDHPRPDFEFDDDATPEDKHRTFRQRQSEYMRARADFIGARTQYEQALVAYARANDLPGAVDRDGRLRESGLRGHEPDREAPEWERVERTEAQVFETWNRASARQAELAAVFRARPYRQAGFGISGVISVASPDLGVSFSRSRPVSELIGEALPVTILLNLVAIPIIYLVAVPTGILASVRHGKAFDIGSGMLLVTLWSMPTVFVGVLCVGYLGSSEYLGDYRFPITGLHDSQAHSYTYLPSRDAEGNFQRGYLLDLIHHIALPVFCLVLPGFAILSKQTRAAMLENFNADYVRTAKAKGVASNHVVFRHVFRNSLLPVITIFASVFPIMLSGSVVVETIFTIPGMGRMLIEAINLRDRELILANTLMIAIVNILALLLADILYALADPRISYD